MWKAEYIVGNNRYYHYIDVYGNQAPVCESDFLHFRKEGTNYVITIVNCRDVDEPDSTIKNTLTIRDNTSGTTSTRLSNTTTKTATFNFVAGRTYLVTLTVCDKFFSCSTKTMTVKTDDILRMLEDEAEDIQTNEGLISENGAYLLAVVLCGLIVAFVVRIALKRSKRRSIIEVSSQVVEAN